ncbi:TIGR02281 family clan AA aspartic protease [uncultured Sphingomonas sp.]|uniref:retropepsin-like aspartic protease family protein n=1 Tax=uncultured Sphingomonas sp. TaxID=158754 RepID=UPI0026180AA8|nr:TIGR02281 family clan AA aspartic protease [uncultured Sphingomonas sp.]
MPDLGPYGPLYLLLAVILLAGVVVRRVPILRTLVNLASWGLVAVVLVLAIDQRGRFDPYFQRITERIFPDQQQVVGDEVRIRMSPDGHFWARATVDGVERRMLIDSGATLTALSEETAATAGLEPRDELVPVLLNTANGTIRAKTATIARLQLGDIRANALPVVVSPAFGRTDILGMNFLSRLKSWRVEDRTLILVPHHPRPAASSSPA